MSPNGCRLPTLEMGYIGARDGLVCCLAIAVRLRKNKQVRKLTVMIGYRGPKQPDDSIKSLFVEHAHHCRHASKSRRVRMLLEAAECRGATSFRRFLLPSSEGSLEVTTGNLVFKKRLRTVTAAHCHEGTRGQGRPAASMLAHCVRTVGGREHRSNH